MTWPVIGKIIIFREYMNRAKELEQLKEDIFSEDAEKVDYAINGLLDIGGDKVFNFFISILDQPNENSWARDAAALALKEMADNRAVEPLFRAILKEENIGFNDTLVHALESLDCSNHFRDLFDILFYHNSLAKMSVHAILSEQKFVYNDEDLAQIREKWEDLQQHTHKSPEYDFCRKMIADAVERYSLYL